MNEGWIKLHRKLLENAVFQNEKCLKIWVWCLLRAGHQKKTTLVGREKLSLKRGQFVMGSIKESEFLEIAKSTLWFWLEFLEREGMVGIKKTNKYSIITIKNWDNHQVVGNKSESNEETDGKQIGTNKNVKNDKNIKNDIQKSEQSSQITEVFKIFSQINPTINYGNTTQRKAVSDLIGKIGFEKTRGAAQYAVAHFGEPYSPTITNPYQLKMKLADLIAYAKKENNKSGIINLNI